MKKLTLLILLIFSLSPLMAQTAEEIITAIEKKTLFDTLQVEAEVVVKNQFGQNTSEIINYSIYNSDTRIDIVSGSDKGQKLLRKDDQMYIYYPDADEVIRLQNSNLKNSFLGSDLSYEDLTKDNSLLATYNVETEEDTLVENTACYTLLLKAKEKKTVYQIQRMYVDKESGNTLKTIYYSLSQKPLREITYSDYQSEGNYTYPKVAISIDFLKKNSITEMIIKTIIVNPTLKKSLFTKEDLIW